MGIYDLFNNYEIRMAVWCRMDRELRIRLTRENMIEIESDQDPGIC